MDKKERDRILEKARAFFKTSIADSHASNTQKLSKLKAFNVNPFTVHYLASFAFGDESFVLDNRLCLGCAYRRNDFV